MSSERSYLYVPGHREDLAAKALASQADAVVLDLEDAVPADRKAVARETVLRILARQPDKPVWVRINPAGSDPAEQDLATLAGATFTGVRLPKCERPEDVRAVAARLPGAPIQCLIETALGVERAYDLASADPAVAGIALGEADLRADLGVTDSAGLLYARSRIVVAARAAALTAPVQSVYVNARDVAGLRRSCREGRSMGFFGRSAIHPAQLPSINEVYTPTLTELVDARAIVNGLAVEEQAGGGTLLLSDGRFVDAAVAQSARRTIALAERLSLETHA